MSKIEEDYVMVLVPHRVDIQGLRLNINATANFPDSVQKIDLIKVRHMNSTGTSLSLWDRPGLIVEKYLFVQRYKEISNTTGSR